MKTLGDWTEITIEAEDGEVIASISSEDIIVKDGYVIRMRPDYDK